jgi:putative ABC transport system permease protein
MRSFEYARLAAEQIKHNPMRSFLTMLGIVIGIAAMIAVISVGDGGRERVDHELQQFGINRMWVFPYEKTSEKSTLCASDAEFLAIKVKEARNLTPVAYRQNEISCGGKKDLANIAGTTENFFKLENVALECGRLLQSADLEYKRRVIVLSEETSEKLFGNADPLMRKVMIQNQQLCVVGVQSRKESSLYGANNESRSFIPLTVFEEVFCTDNIDEITMRADSMDETDSVGIKIVNALEERYGKHIKYNMLNLNKQIRLAQNITDTFRTVVSGIAAISLLVGGIGIMNVMLVTVKERTREIGIRKALGATDMQVFRQFLAESLTHAAIGGSLGVGLGIGMSFLCASVIDVPVSLSAANLMLCTGFSLAVGLFFGIYPAMKAARMDPVEALRFE